MKSNLYTTDGKYEVKAGKIVIARSYLGQNGYEVRVLQGMDRYKTLEKIQSDCPEFLTNNNWNTNKHPLLFSK